MATKKTAAAKPARKPFQIRLVLEIANTTPSAALAQLTPIQRERTEEAQKNGTSTRLVIVFPSSDTRDLDEAIRALPGGLQAAVLHASKHAATLAF